MLGKIKIGKVELKNNIFLAPMAGVTDLPFRVLCKENGCGLAYTEMVSVKGLIYGGENTEVLLKIAPQENPVAVQLFGSDPKLFGEAVRRIEHYKFDIIDINMGCPAPKIVKNGDGSALMQNPELIGNIVNEVCSVTEKPVTVKIRKGFDENNINAEEVAKIAEKNGASAITVHGRTREQYYSGKADLDIIKKVKEAVNIPVIGNGDIVDRASAENMLEYTKCDAVMVGRAAQGNPWVFKKILYGAEYVPPSSEEIFDMCLRHIGTLVEEKGEYTGIREMRKHISHYTKGVKGAAEARVKINKAESLGECKEILTELLLT